MLRRGTQAPGQTAVWMPQRQAVQPGGNSKLLLDCPHQGGRLSRNHWQQSNCFPHLQLLNSPRESLKLFKRWGDIGTATCAVPECPRVAQMTIATRSPQGSPTPGGPSGNFCSPSLPPSDCGILNRWHKWH